MNEDALRYRVSLKFEGISLPPFQDILILGKKCPHGPEGMIRCTNLLGPEEFETISLPEEEKVDAILINKKILLRLPCQTVIKILRKRVFPFIGTGEMVRVDFNVVLSCDEIEGAIDAPQCT